VGSASVTRPSTLQAFIRPILFILSELLFLVWRWRKPETRKPDCKTGWED
jgi:hypothetical protein